MKNRAKRSGGESSIHLSFAKSTVSILCWGLLLFGLPAGADDTLKWGFIDTSGNEVIALQFNGALSFSEGLAAVRVGEKWGYIDRTGKMIIEPRFDDAGEFSEGLAFVQVDEQNKDAPDSIHRYGYINKSGELVIKPQFNDAKKFTEQIALVSMDYNHWFYIDHDGTQCIKETFPLATPFSDGVAAVLKQNPTNSGTSDDAYFADQTWSFIDKSGNCLLAAGVRQLSLFHDGVIAVALGPEQDYGRANNWTFMDKSGKLIMQPGYGQAHGFSEGLAAVEAGHFLNLGFNIRTWISDGWEYIDKTGVVQIAGPYQGADPFSDGYASVEKGGKWGYIDKSGKLVVPFKYDGSLVFKEGLAAVVVKSVAQ